MNEEEFKALVGEAAFKAMTPEQVKASIDKFSSSSKELADLKKEKEDREKKDKDQDLSLNDKVKQEREDQEKKATEQNQLEAALKFNLTSADFLKANESILPKEIGDIFKAADKERYETAVDKANATRAAIIQSFFDQQSNVEFLTESQKVTLADYLKLTKSAKEFKAKEIYENLFEPALATLKRVKKAEELGRANGGLRDASGDAPYRNKLMDLSRKHYLGESA